MTQLLRKMAALVTITGPYRHVSEAWSKALPKGHAFSKRRWPTDNGDGQFERGNVFCQDAEFWAKERSLNQPAGYVALAANDEIFMMDWPSGARLRSIRIKRTVAAAVDNAGVTTNPAILNYMDSNTNSGVFPTFEVIAKDPQDASFVAISLGQAGAVTDGFLPITAAALAYGINRRKTPLSISIKVAGAVPALSGCVMFTDFVGQHL